jgi:hypothetical protein
VVGPKKGEVTGEWRRLHNEGLHDFCSSPNIVKVFKSKGMGWAGQVACTGDTRDAYSVLVGIPEREGPLRRPMLGWDDNIVIELKGIGWRFVDEINLAEDMASGGFFFKGDEPSGFIKCRQI